MIVKRAPRASPHVDLPWGQAPRVPSGARARRLGRGSLRRPVSGPHRARRARGAVRLARRESGSRVRAESARPIQARARRCPRARCTPPPARPPRGRARNGRCNPAGDSIVCTPKLVSPSWARTFRIDPRKGGLHLIEALTRRACYRVLPLIVLWWCRFAAPAGRLGPGWCNLNKGCSRVCSPPDLVAVFVGTSVSTTSAEEKHYYARPSKPLLGAPGCGRAYESCRFVQ